MNIKMSDVAKHAGVSAATVSHVINGNRPVKEANRKKVLAAIEELDYKLDLNARNFRTGSRNLVGLILPNLASAFDTSLFRTCESLFIENGYNIVVMTSRFDKQLEKSAIHTMSSGLVDGIIISTHQNPIETLNKAIPPDFPCVLINTYEKSHRFDQICIDFSQAMSDNISRLVKKGHDKIGFMDGPEHIDYSKSAYVSYRDALRKHGLEYREEYCP